MSNDTQPNWYYCGDGVCKNDIALPDAPPWRNKKAGQESPYRPLSDKEIKMVNAALILRRPLLITGKPGSGKSSLADAVCQELGLGEKVLPWRITTQSKFTDGLYSYDALSRLQDIQFKEQRDGQYIAEDIANYLKLEALGAAFASKKQRVVLIDEIDKSQMDLPNNLLHLFEENEFEIPELKRLGKPFTPFHDAENYHTFDDGIVQCDIDTFPLIIMTSNAERDFPPAFMRRCLHLDMQLPDATELAKIVNRHFDAVGKRVDQEALARMITLFLEERDKDDQSYLSTDQLLNAVYLLHEEKIDIKQEGIFGNIFRNLFG
jgi:MoxR-like ATPase